MGTRLLRHFFDLGTVLALTPRFDHRVTLFWKWYSIFIVLSMTGTTVWSMYCKSFYSADVYVKVVVSFLLEMGLLMFVCYSSLTVAFLKVEPWQRLMGNLKLIVVELGDSNRIGRNVRIGVVALVVNMAVSVVIFRFWVSVFGWQYGTWFNVSWLQLYILFGFNVFLSVILSVVLDKYRLVKDAILGILKINVSKWVLVSLKKAEYSMAFLKETIVTFNDIFGWLIFLDISITTLYILNNFDYIFVSTSYKDRIPWRIMADATPILTTFIGTVSLIVMCDLVLKEAEEIQTLAHKLSRNNMKTELKQLCEIISENFPKFSAARFFTIDRSTILSILWTAITFLIVMIQTHLQT